ncbi:MAG TPA: LodA/GoxA family CTQ-dependent oxidase [Allosphingosinicella sp.]
MTDESRAAGGGRPLAAADIESLGIYPPLGIARVGNAIDPANPFIQDYVLSVETIGGPHLLPDGSPAVGVGDFRADNGAIKRHGARFRIYAKTKSGEHVELTISSGVRIRWRVALANLKAGWYEFNQAMDLGEPLSQPAKRRNWQLPTIPGGRRSLDIVPTPIAIEGADLAGPDYCFDDGLFCAKPVYLGELRTDPEGRLIVLGGRGAAAPFRPNLQPITFANNFGWHDDVADGPVRATVVFDDGTEIEAEPAFVAVTPPNYAPGLVPVVTMDDTVRETFIASQWLDRPSTTSFTNDVWPIFDRLTGLQWIDHGLFVLHGAGSPIDARDPAVIDRLRDPAQAQEDWRRALFELFRDPMSKAKYAGPMLPQIFGDAYGESEDDPRVELALTPTQYEHLSRWADGDFTDDWPGSIPQPPAFGDLDAEQQMRHLERAPLHDCIGGPFHPGIELTWTMRLKSVWQRPYRLKIIDGNAPAAQNFGPELTPAACLADGGPYDGVAAGALTRFLGVPWQTDGTSCNSDADYGPWFFLSMPTFWGVRVPDQVFAEANYVRARDLDPAVSQLQIAKHFTLRVDWLRDVRGSTYYDRLNNMIQKWSNLGMVIAAPEPVSHLPEGLRVEQGRVSRAGADPKRKLVASVEALAHPPSKVRAMTKLAAEAVVSIDETTPPEPARRRFRQDEV